MCRQAIGARYAGRSGSLANLNVTFRAPGLAERVCARAAHYWVLRSEAAGIVGRMDLDDTWWAVVHGAGAATPLRTIEHLIGSRVGEVGPIEVLATDPWSARMLLVDRYQDRRIFLLGDAAHLNPPWGGHGYNTGIGDAVNLGWKLVAVLAGWAGPALLDSYAAERRPVAERTIADAAAQENRLAPSFAEEGLADDGPAGAAARNRVATAVQVKRGEFHSLGLVLGYHYAGSPVIVDDNSPVPPAELEHYHGSARPGTRLPHRWLADGSSLYDHLGPGVTLLRTRTDPAGAAELLAAADHAGVPLATPDLPELAEPEVADLCGAPLVLVRPDQHIAWRGDTPSDARALLDVIIGRSPDVGVLDPVRRLSVRPDR